MTFTASDCDFACLSLFQVAFHVVSQQPVKGLTHSNLEQKTENSVAEICVHVLIIPSINWLVIWLIKLLKMSISVS